MASLSVVCRGGRLRLLPVGWALYAARTGIAEILPAAVRETWHRHHPRWSVQLWHSREWSGQGRLFRLRACTGEHIDPSRVHREDLLVTWRATEGSSPTIPVAPSVCRERNSRHPRPRGIG